MDGTRAADRAVSNAKPGANTVSYWLTEIDNCAKREKNWRTDAEDAVQLYEGQKRPENSFNVLYSNTETLLPAIYNNPPRPVVKRRYEDEDPIGKAVAEVVRRGLEYAIDTPDTKYTSFNELCEAVVIGALVPGRAVTRFKYDPEFITKGGTAEKEGKEITAGGGTDPVEQSDEIESSEVVPREERKGKRAERESGSTSEEVNYEAICGVNWPWDRFYMGFARRWSDVPWIAYEHRMTKADLVENFKATWAEKIPMTEEGEKREDKSGDNRDTKGAPKTAVVYEIWHKSRKKVIFVARDYKDSVIKTVDDPLGLPGFFDCPRPLQFVNRNTNLVPVVPYKLYEEQARELNRISMRINKVLAAIKFRGFYNGQIKDLNDIMTLPENSINPAKDVAMLAESGGLEKHIWLMPLEKLIQVVQALYLQRQQCKQVIYEITGISDILRGSSVASETATAQNIKNQWGTLRLKRMQKQTQTYIRDCMRIMTAIQGGQFDVSTWKSITMLPYPTAQEKQQARMQLQQLQQMATQSMPPPQPPQPGQPPTPPQPPQIPPELQQQMQQLAPVAQAPFTWEDLVKVMQDNFQRGYHIDVETNSTVDPDATEDKQNITDLLTALAQTMQSFQPMVESGALPLGAMKAILLTITRRFQFGPEVEDQLKTMADQMPQKQDPAVQKAQMEMEKMKAEMAGDQQNQQGEMQMKQMEMQLKQKEIQMKMQLMDKELAIKEAELDLKRQELGLQQQELQQKQQLNEITNQGKVQAAQATAQSKMMQIELGNQAAKAKHDQAMQAPAPSAQH